MSFAALNWALELKDLSSTQKLVVLVMANYADEDGVCYPRHETIATKACLSRESVARAVTALVEDHGVVSELQRPRKKSGRFGFRTYQLHLNGKPEQAPRDGESHGLSPDEGQQESPSPCDGKSHGDSPRDGESRGPRDAESHGHVTESLVDHVTEDHTANRGIEPSGTEPPLEPREKTRSRKSPDAGQILTGTGIAKAPVGEIKPAQPGMPPPRPMRILAEDLDLCRQTANRALGLTGKAQLPAGSTYFWEKLCLACANDFEELALVCGVAQRRCSAAQQGVTLRYLVTNYDDLRSVAYQSVRADRDDSGGEDPTSGNASFLAGL